MNLLMCVCLSLLITVGVTTGAFIVTDTPYSLNYEVGDILSMALDITNVPEDVTACHVYDHSGYVQECKQEIDFIDINRWRVRLRRVLSEPHGAQYYIHLLNDKKLCAVKQFIEAVNVNRSSTSPDIDDCLKICSVMVNMKQKCELFDLAMNSSLGDQVDINTDVSAHELNNVTNKWIQVDFNNNVISAAPATRLLHTELTLTAESFDHNTRFYCQQDTSRTEPSGNITTVRETGRRVHLQLLNHTLNKNYNVTVKYSDTTAFQFSCRQHYDFAEDIQVALIHPSGNTMMSFRSDDVSVSLSASDNGTVLCCVCYVVFNIRRNSHVKRFVLSKTLLIYEAEASVNIFYIVSVLSVAGMLSLLAVVILWVRRNRCTKYGAPSQTTASDTCTRSQGAGPDLNPFYLNLLSHLREGCDRQIEEQEHHYEEID